MLARMPSLPQQRMKTKEKRKGKEERGEGSEGEGDVQEKAKLFPLATVKQNNHKTFKDTNSKFKTISKRILNMTTKIIWALPSI